MYLLPGIVLFIIGILLLICVGKKSKPICRIAMAMVILGVLLLIASLGMFFLVLSGRVTLPLK